MNLAKPTPKRRVETSASALRNAGPVGTSAAVETSAATSPKRRRKNNAQGERERFHAVYYNALRNFENTRLSSFPTKRNAPTRSRHSSRQVDLASNIVYRNVFTSSNRRRANNNILRRYTTPLIFEKIVFFRATVPVAASS